jgi:hypothetical protein
LTSKKICSFGKLQRKEGGRVVGREGFAYYPEEASGSLK